LPLATGAFLKGSLIMAYDPIGTKPDDQRPEWRQRDDLGVNDPERIIKGADFDAEFNAVKAEFDRINRHGIVASVKYNGTNIMYSDGVSAVTPLGNSGYNVEFDSEIAEFDQHYAVQITMFVSGDNRPTIPTVTGLTNTSVQFTVTEFESGSQGEPSAPVGFSMIIVDMASD
jgi:hypothetical protein